MEEKKKGKLLDARAISNLIVLLIGILFYLAVSNLSAVRFRLSSLMSVVAPFIAGFGVAYLLNAPMRFFEKKCYHRLKMKRGLSIITVYLLALAIVGILINLILPQVAQSVMSLMNNVEFYLQNLNGLVHSLVERFGLEGDGIEALVVSYQDLVNKVVGMVTKAVPQLLNLGVALGSGIISAVTALISSIYMLAGKDKLIAQLKKLVYATLPLGRADRVLSVCRRANGVFAGFINGKLIDSAIIGGLCFFLSSILRIPFAILMSVIVGVTNVIPFFGPIIGAVPCVMILIIVDPWSALKFGILVIALQQFDGNILGPKILGDSTGLSAIWVLVAIVVGGGLFGFPGMLLGVPTFAVLYSLMCEWTNARLARKRIDGDGNATEKQD